MVAAGLDAAERNRQGENTMRRTFASLLTLCISIVSIELAGVALGGEGRIEVWAGDFRTTRYLSLTHQAEIKKRNLLTGYGEAEYGFRIPRRLV